MIGLVPIKNTLSTIPIIDKAFIMLNVTYYLNVNSASLINLT